MIWNPWKEIKRLQADLGFEKERSSAWCASLLSHLQKLADAEEALHDITQLETPRCSRGVQKAVNIAREALNK